MKNSKIITGAAALVAIIAVAGVAASSFAYGGDLFRPGANFSPVDRQAAEEALENNDYDSWQELMSGSPMADKIKDKITEENFNKLAEADGLMKAGKYDEARQIREELGFGFGPGMGKMGPGGKMPLKPKNMEAVKVALDNSDYDAWLEAVGADSPIAEKINEDNFSKLVEAHKLQEQAREILEELGLKRFGR